MFPGNTTDVTTVERVKTDLKGWRLGRCIFVGDAGMNSEENRRTLALANGKYILAAKMRGGDEVTQQVMTRAGRYHEVRDNLRVKEVLVGDQGDGQSPAVARGGWRLASRGSTARRPQAARGEAEPTRRGACGRRSPVPSGRGRLEACSRLPGATTPGPGAAGGARPADPGSGSRR